MQKKAPAITKGTWFQSISAKVYVMAATVTGHIFKEGVCEVGCIEIGTIKDFGNLAVYVLDGYHVLVFQVISEDANHASTSSRAKALLTV